ncbi:hypothetical protein [Methylovirgula sp. 4M-Z18]|uniref:hypothetical protein n=1 Tax=Methylovirgula sp. 4M-Z18 TaxID=2293567 RepID=UPI000E2F6203|nr:hypothetical protein [Methylovirgula sp. 4M-Z18]RFB81444.1 hypothetical protein DYH55_08490 [Methylovirgula sp. 4M-Z18]
MTGLNDVSEMDDDAVLVAFVDGKLDDAATIALQARLANEPDLLLRLTQIRAGDVAFAPAFEALLAQAPTTRLEASLSQLLASHPVQAAPRARGWRVAAALALLACGIVLGRFAPSWVAAPQSFIAANEQKEDWRMAVAEYAALYTTETFAGSPPDASAQADELARLGEKVGLTLRPDRIALSDAQYRGAQILAYGKAALGQIVYTDAAGHPILFCMIANGEADTGPHSENRGAFSSVAWAHDGRGYILIAPLPREKVAQMADALVPRF